MGSALARAFIDAGHGLTVWNRTASKTAPLRKLGARDAGINSEVPDFISNFFMRALAAGYGDEDIASITKIMRENPIAEP